jgi:hypothetical protein
MIESPAQRWSHAAFGALGHAESSLSDLNPQETDMKIMMLAALAFAVPAVAQDTPAADPAAQTMPAQPAPTDPAPADAAPVADPAAPPPAATPAPIMTMGPLAPPPAPAPKESYPRCSKTVKDSCINPGGK